MSIDHGKVLVACRRKLEAYRDAYGLEYVGGQELSSLLSDIDRALAQPAEAVELPTPYHYADGGKGEPLFTANQVRASVAVATDAAQGAVAFVPVHPKLGPLWGDTYPAGDAADGRSPHYERMPLFTHPQAAPAQGREKILVDRFTLEVIVKALGGARDRVKPTERDWLYDLRDAAAGMLAAAPAQEIEAEPASCVEADVCPTEMAVLQRFWRPQQAAPAQGDWIKCCGEDGPYGCCGQYLKPEDRAGEGRGDG